MFFLRNVDVLIPAASSLDGHRSGVFHAHWNSTEAQLLFQFRLQLMISDCGSSSCCPPNWRRTSNRGINNSCRTCNVQSQHSVDDKFPTQQLYDKCCGSSKSASNSQGSQSQMCNRTQSWSELAGRSVAMVSEACRMDPLRFALVPTQSRSSLANGNERASPVRFCNANNIALS